jgi:hypothetical protein
LVAFAVRLRLGALLILCCAGVLAFGVEQARAETTAEPSPTRLWQEYPLEPLAGKTPRQRISITEPTGVGNPSSPNWILLIGGLALVVLILTDTLFLALSSRVLRT